jgi:transcriptional regulator with XRE-family HTH domain
MSVETASQRCSSSGSNRRRHVLAAECRPSVLHLGYAIRRRRSAVRMMQAELACRADMDRAYLSRVESGRISVGWSPLGRLATALDTNVLSIVLDAENIARSKAGAEPDEGLSLDRWSGAASGGAPSVATLGEVFRRARLDRGLSRPQCACLSGLSVQTIAKLEFGERTPKWDTLCALSVALACAVSELVIWAETAASECRPKLDV